MKKYYLIIILVLFNNLIYPQDTYRISIADPLLILQQSPVFMGSGQVGVSVPMIDPLGFYYNPAQLGYFSKENNFSFLVLPKKINWYSGYTASPNNLNYGFSAGYNFKNYNGLPLSVGAGFIYNKFDYNFSGSQDNFKCFSLGAGFDYFLQFYAGFSVKLFNSEVYMPTVNRRTLYKSNGTAYDFGVMVTAPFSELFLNNVKYRLDDKSIIKPKLNLTLGYSLTNIGKEVYYSDLIQKEPLPRTARLGYTAEIGADMIHNGKKINIINFDFTAEAEDLLVENYYGPVNDNINSVSYQGIFGRIKPLKHILGLKDDGGVVIHRGNILRLFETLYITSGRYYGEHYNNIRSNGYGFSSEGVFKLLSISVDNQTVRFIADHFAIEYFDTNNFLGLFDTNFQGIAVYVKGF